MSRVWLVLIICAVAGAQQLPDLVMTNSAVNTVYEKPSPDSEIAGQIPPRSSSAVQNITKTGDDIWVKMSTESVSGWMLVSNLDRNSRVAIRDYRNAMLQIRRPGAAVREVDGVGGESAGKSLVVPSEGDDFTKKLDSIMSIGIMPLTGLALLLGILVVIKMRKG